MLRPTPTDIADIMVLRSNPTLSPDNLLFFWLHCPYDPPREA